MLARSLLVTLATMLAATMVVLSATAQTPERSSAEAIEALDRAVNLMDSTMIWRHQSYGPDEEDSEDQYKKIREAAALFMRFAGEQFVTMAIEGIEYWFDDLRLHDPSVVVPRTIEEAVQKSHERRDHELTVKVAGTLADALEHARRDKVAEAKYGPIVDNPEYYRAIKSPMSGLDLLRNVKRAIDHDALLPPPVQHSTTSSGPLAKTGSLTPKYRRKECISGVYPPKGRLRVFTGPRRPGRRAMTT